jgi:hypothetical protein
MNELIQIDQGDFLDSPLGKSYKSFEGGELNNQGK